MNRRDFLRQLSGIAAGAIILPSIEQVLAITQPRRKYWPGWSAENRYIEIGRYTKIVFNGVDITPNKSSYINYNRSIVYGDVRSNRGIDIGSEQRLIPIIGITYNPNDVGHHVP